jgi:hypothetical protein
MRCPQPARHLDRRNSLGGSTVAVSSANFNPSGRLAGLGGARTTTSVAILVAAPGHLKTVKALGLSAPLTLKVVADEVIE